MKPSPEVLSAVEAVLPIGGPGTGLRPKEVHVAVGLWARTTMQHALRALVDEGRAEYDGPDCRRLYRRAPHA